MKTKLRRTQILVTEQQYQALQRLADDTGLTVSEHIRRAVDEYLERKQTDDARGTS